MKQTFFARRSFTIMLIVVFSLPFLWMGSRRALLSNRNDIKDWLPDDYPETAVHTWFQSHFPHEQFVLASWDGCTLNDQRLQMLAKKLVPPKDGELPAAAQLSGPQAGGKVATDPPNGKPQYFKSVLTGRSLMDELEARYPDLSEEEVLKRLEGSLIGKDHNKTCLVVILSKEAGGKNLRLALEQIRELARQCGIEPPKKQPVGGFFAGLAQRAEQSMKEMVFGRDPPGPGIRMGGPPVDNVAIDTEGEYTLYRLAGLSTLVGLGISWLVFRSVRLTLIVFFTAVLSAGTGLAFVFFTGGTYDAILLSMPSLLYVLAISGSIHIVNYYHDAIREAGLEGAPDRALAHGWLPCTIAALTTALGLGSLCASDIVPIYKFGFYSACGVMTTLAFTFLFLPACLQLWPSRHYAQLHGRKGDTEHSETRTDRWWKKYGTLIVRHNVAVGTACFALMAVTAIPVAMIWLPGDFLPRVNTSVKLMKLFSSDAEIIHHYAWLEKHIGPLVPMEVVLRIDNQKCKLTMVERMRLAEQVEQAMETLPDVGGSLSAATFAPDITPEEGMVTLRRIRDSVLNKKLEGHRAEFREYLSMDKEIGLARLGHDPTLAELGVDAEIAKLLRTRGLATLSALENYGEGDKTALDRPTLEETLASIRGISSEAATAAAAAVDAWQIAHSEELWRVSARVKALDDHLDYAVFVDELKTKVEPVLDAYRQGKVAGLIAYGKGKDGGNGKVEGIEATYTGLVPLVYKTQHELMKGLFQSLAMAFVLIAGVMMIVLKSPSAGLVSMIPNLFPVVVIFGAMGWLNILVDIGTMMTASVALGVAVDDTIHYLTWYRRALDEGHDRHGAIMSAYERCGSAMTQTTLIGGLGLAVFAFSTFTPTQRFGVLMLALLAVALVGDLVFLPALLSGRLGRFFGVWKKTPGPVDVPPKETLPTRTPGAESDNDGDEPVSVSLVESATKHSRHRDPSRSTSRVS